MCTRVFMCVCGRLKGRDIATGVTLIRCGGQQQRSAGVKLVMGAIFHKAHSSSRSLK